jgi:multisubunit Na+/H+ antiporter MnhG subunit
MDGASGSRVTTRESTETKASTKTSEFYVYLAAVAAVLIASYIVDGFNATEGWMFFTYLSIGYMISRGLAKAGSRDPYRSDDRTDVRTDR